jgi:UDP-N-acetylmuramyl tripeptide synthase
MSRSLPPPPYLIVGAARAGASAARALAAITDPAGIRVWDEYDGPETRRTAADLGELGVAVDLGEWRPGSDLSRFTVIKSPGVPSDAPPVRAALDAGATVIDELELGVRLGASAAVAITGTDGKSTVSMLLARALAHPAAPLAVCGNTDFGSPLSAATASERPLVVECSSYQLEFCSGPFSELAVLTNFTPEHLHRHSTMDFYSAAKRRLFTAGRERVATAVVNVDSDFGRRLAAELREGGSEVATVGVADSAGYHVLDARWDAGQAQVRLATPTGPVELTTQLPGRHNAENTASALAGCDLLGVPRSQALRALSASPGVPGRWERVANGQPFEVVVDFAHTPAGLRQVLLTARRITIRSGGRVHMVLGGGGGNNPGKRLPLGRVSSLLADRVILTEGSGRGEPRETVVADLLAGWEPDTPAPEIELDRRLAIRRALLGAEPGDVVLIVGRGAWRTLFSNRSGGGRAFDDREVAAEELVRLGGRSAAEEEVSFAEQVSFQDQAVAARSEVVSLLADHDEAQVRVEAEPSAAWSAGQADPVSSEGSQPLPQPEHERTPHSAPLMSGNDGQSQDPPGL